MDEKKTDIEYREIVNRESEKWTNGLTINYSLMTIHFNAINAIMLVNYQLLF
jgi:hypothetical protein